MTKTNKFLVRRCPDIDEKLVKAFAKVKYTKKIKDMYEEILMKRRLAAKFKGKKLKSNRDHLKDGHLRCQSKLPEMKLDTEFFYDTMYGSEEKSTEMGGRQRRNSHGIVFHCFIFCTQFIRYCTNCRDINSIQTCSRECKINPTSL